MFEIGRAVLLYFLSLFLSHSTNFSSGQTGIVILAPSGRDNRTYDTHIRAYTRARLS